MSAPLPERRDASLEKHTVLRAHDVVRNFPLRITAADAWGDALVVGTADGSLLVFAQAEPPAPPPRGEPPADAEPPRYEVRGWPPEWPATGSALRTLQRASNGQP
jgi:hypothetical protein